MNVPAETPDEPPAKTNRRTRWITGAAAAAVVAVVVGVGIGVAVALSKNEVKFSGGAPSNRGRTLDHRISVRQHRRQQACGPNYSQHRDILIPPHFRGPARAP